jgi:hypothetical protein
MSETVLELLQRYPLIKYNKNQIEAKILGSP